MNLNFFPQKKERGGEDMSIRVPAGHVAHEHKYTTLHAAFPSTCYVVVN